MRKVLSVFFALFFLLVAIPAQTFYLATGEELKRLEEIWTTSETNRQTWESQAKKWRIEAETLQKDSVNLNALLRAERATTSSLKKSFAEYEAAQSRINTEKDLQIRRLQTDNEKVRAQRNSLAMISAGVFCALIFYLFTRIRKVFGFP